MVRGFAEKDSGRKWINKGREVHTICIAYSNTISMPQKRLDTAVSWFNAASEVMDSSTASLEEAYASSQVLLEADRIEKYLIKLDNIINRAVMAKSTLKLFQAMNEARK